LKKYTTHGEKLVLPGDYKKIAGVEFIGRKLLSHKVYKIDKNDKLSSERSVIRHNPDKLAKIIFEL